MVVVGSRSARLAPVIRRNALLLIRVAISIARWRSLPGATTSWTNPSLKAVSALNSSPVKRYRKALPKPARSDIRIDPAFHLDLRETAIGSGDDDVRRQHQLDPECETNALDRRDQRFGAEPAVQIDRINVVFGKQRA